MNVLERLNRQANECLLKIFKETSRLAVICYFIILNTEENVNKPEALGDSINIAIRQVINKLTTADAYGAPILIL